MNFLILGCGALGKKVAAAVLASKNQVLAVRRQKDCLSDIKSLSIDFDKASSNYPNVPPADIVFVLFPPPTKGQQDDRSSRAIEMLNRWSLPPKRIVLLSTTAVYGDCNGEWIDETCPPNPQTDRGKRRQDAEQQWHRWTVDKGCELVILRVAGIYGPDKLPRARLLRRDPMPGGVAIPYSNRIHIDDLAAICLAAAKNGGSDTYNVSDGQPTTMLDYFNQVADLLQLPRPPLISMADAQQTLTAGMLSYLNESRRLKNTKMLQQLGVRLQYPDLKSGLLACIQKSEDDV